MSFKGEKHIKKRLRLFLSLVSLTVTSFALAFGVFSATSPIVTINGTINYVATSALVKIASSIENGFQDDDGDGNLVDINPTRYVTVTNFNESYNMLSSFVVESGNSGRFLTGDRWNIDGVYFNPAPNVVPSNQTPPVGWISATIKIKFVISNYSLYAIKVNVSSTIESLADIVASPSADIGYDLTDANIASIAPANSARTVITSADSYIYLKLNNLSAEFSQISFSFKVEITPA